MKHSTGSQLIRLAALALLAAGCLPASRSTTGPGTGYGGNAPLAFDEGDASYYSDAFEGRPTASGEPFAQEELTAAHRSYPFGTIVRVINLGNGRDVIVRINDRGPHKPSRVIDLSRRGAEALRMIREGVVRVRVEVLKWGG